MKDLIVLFVLAAITALIIRYLRREKKKGAVCIGCPCGGSCSGGCHGLDEFGSGTAKMQISSGDAE